MQLFTGTDASRMAIVANYFPIQKPPLPGPAAVVGKNPRIAAKLLKNRQL
jgi:hypothetical protein